MAETLGQHLIALRTSRKMTLRDVEDATKKAVSNAYLSQIENDKIKQPSPNILHALAQLYGVDYQKLMQMAGYEVTQRGRAPYRGKGVLAEYNVTPEEEAQLLDYLRYLRSKKQREGDGRGEEKGRDGNR